MLGSRVVLRLRGVLRSGVEELDLVGGQDDATALIACRRLPVFLLERDGEERL